MWKASKLIQRVYLVCCYIYGRIANWMQQLKEHAIHKCTEKEIEKVVHIGKATIFYSQTMETY